MTMPCLILSSLGHMEQWYIADRSGEIDYQLVEIPERIEVRIVCTFDNRIAVERTIVVNQDEGKLHLVLMAKNRQEDVYNRGIEN